MLAWPLCGIDVGSPVIQIVKGNPLGYSQYPGEPVHAWILVSSPKSPINTVSVSILLQVLYYAKFSGTQFSTRSNDTLTTSLLSCRVFFFHLAFCRLYRYNFVFLCV